MKAITNYRGQILEFFFSNIKKDFLSKVSLELQDNNGKDVTEYLKLWMPNYYEKLAPLISK